jgi:diguanylate cyclase
MDPLLFRVAESVGEARSLEQLARSLLGLLQELTALESVYLTEIDEPAGLQRILYASNAGRLQIREGLQVAWDDTLCRRALASGQRYAENVGERWPDADAARELGIVSFLTEPVHGTDGRLFGTLCGASSEPQRLSSEQARLVALFARLLGQQVEREALLRQLREANATLVQHALTDPLTGLANRRMLVEGLRRELARIGREGGALEVAFVDFDGFKAINDRYGHEVGDRFLALMAERLRLGLRGSDLIARYGGDEFVVVGSQRQLPEADSVSLQERIEALTSGSVSIDALSFDYGGASVGVVVATEPSEDADILLARADAAMYARKQLRRAAEGWLG